MSMLEDGDIINRMRRGDVIGLEALLRQYGPPIKGWLRLRFGLPTGDDALEDAVHDAALILWKRAKRLDPDNNLGGFFYKTSSRELVRALRGRRGSPQLWDGAAEDVAAPEPNPEPGEFTIALASWLQSFPDKERELLSVDAAGGFSMPADEIAALIGTTTETVYTLRSRTKARLDDFLRRWQNDRTSRRNQGGTG